MLDLCAKCFNWVTVSGWMQATFFITYVLTSGWASLSSEVMQLFGLVWNFLKKYVFRIKEDDPASVPSFPYHTEIPRVLLLGLLGFTCSILAPLILPFLLVYFLLGYVVYRNQASNVCPYFIWIVVLNGKALHGCRGLWCTWLCYFVVAVASFNDVLNLFLCLRWLNLTIVK